jgi:hypothetical protein
MKTIFGMLVVLCATGVVGCGDKDSGPEGTWVLDTNAFFDANRAMFMGQVQEGLDQAKAGMAQLDQALAQLPAEQREAMRKQAREQMLDNAGEHRELMEAFLRSPEEATRLGEKMARKQLDSMKATLKLKGDKTYESSYVMGSNTENGSGTWSASGNQVTIQPKVKKGEPVTGDDAKAWTVTLSGNTMSGKPEANGPTIVLKRA